jgi:hypothetical protein
MFKVWRFLVLVLFVISFGLGFALRVGAEPKNHISKTETQVLVMTLDQGIVKILWSNFDLNKKVHNQKPNGILITVDGESKVIPAIKSGIAVLKTDPGIHSVSMYAVYLEMESIPKIVYVGPVQAEGQFEVMPFIKQVWRKLWDTVT